MVGKKCQQGQGLVEILDRVKRNNQQRMKICQKICTYSCLHSQFAFTFKCLCVAFWLQMFTFKYHQNQWLAEKGLTKPTNSWEMNQDFSGCDFFGDIFASKWLSLIAISCQYAVQFCNLQFSAIPWILGEQRSKM